MRHTLGSYVHSYFVINIGTPDAIPNIKQLPPEHQATFIHEYTHFLQNITGGFGVSQIWNTFDRSRQLISSLQKSPDPVLRLPLKGSVVEQQEVYYHALKAIQGDSTLPAGMNDSLAFIKSLNFYLDDRYERIDPLSRFHFLKLRIEDSEGGKCGYKFGEIAVSETMAYLMERKYFGHSPLPNFPYHSCQLLGKYLETDITENDEYLFVLCDVALATHFPGRMFYQILLEMSHREFKPQNGREVIDYGVDYLRRNKWNPVSDMEKAVSGAVNVVEDLFRNKIFEHTREWFKYILGSGYVTRRDNPYFFLELYNAPVVFEGWWNNVIAQFGTPQLYNAKKDRYFNAPLELKGIEASIEPIWLSTIQQIHHTLLAGSRRCTLYDVCDKSQNVIVTDYRCDTAPWDRATDDQTCAYASLWVMFMLKDKIVK